MRDRLVKIALVVGGSAVGLVLALSFVGGRSANHEAYDDIYRESSDPELRVELIPEANEWVNSDGFFGREYPLQKPPGVFRVVGLGDSVAMYYSAERLNHLSLLEARLPDLAQRPVEVLNLSVAGYETAHQVRSLVVKGLKYDPDFVVLSYCINDGIDFVELAQRLRPDADQGERPADDALHTHELVRGASDDYTALFRDHIRESSKWQESIAALTELRGIAEEEELGVLVLIFPSLLELDDYYLGPAHRALVAHAESLGFGVIDLTPAFTSAAARVGGEVALRTGQEDAIHPSPAAYEVATDVAMRWLSETRPWEAP